METYEKKYKEALERAKDFMNGEVHYALKKGENIMCWVFPELCESEDERIRQDIITTLSIGVSCDESALHPCAHTTLKEALAWLEKQGEKKSIESTKTKLNESMIKPDPNPYWTLAPEYKLTNEQKPADWSEEDERMMMFCCDYLDDNQKSWLLSLKDRIQPQPKQDWSEEDEKFLDGIIANIEYLMDRANSDTLKQSLQKRIEWLKSLRPQSTWKPSDYELEVLRLAAEKDGTCLMGLYEQLKKL